MRRLAILLTAFAAVPVAAAIAAPTPGIWVIGSGESSGSFTLSATKMSKVTAKSNFKCNKLNAVIPGTLTVRSGSFSYSGRLKGQPGTIVFKGHFTSSNKATGTTVITKGSCRSGTLKWTAKPVAATSGQSPATPVVNAPAYG